MHKTRSLVSLLAFTAFAFAAAGCGGGGGGGGTAPIPGGGGGGGGGTPPPSTPPPPPATLAADTTHIEFAGQNHDAQGQPTGRTNGTGARLGAEPSNTPNNVSAGTDTCGIQPGSDTNGGIDNLAGPTHHHHVFVGVIESGTQDILPATIGFSGSNGSNNAGFYNSAQCLYYTHTHDESGLVHIEPLVTGPHDFTFNQFAALWGQDWGQTISDSQIGNLSGPVAAYVGTAGSVDNSTGPTHGTYPVTSYKYVPDIMSQPLTSHTAIWLVVGTIPQTLPQVNFITEF